MQTIKFVLLSRVGSFQEGSLTGESGNATIFLQTGDQVSHHLARHQVAGYEREGSNLIVKLADGREIVRADGKVISSSRPQIIQNLEGGILADLNVVEGDVLSQGDILARLHDTKFQSSVDELRDQIAALEIRRLRLEAEMAGENEFSVKPEHLARSPDIVAAEMALLRARQLDFSSLR